MTARSWIPSARLRSIALATTLSGAWLLIACGSDDHATEARSCVAHTTPPPEVLATPVSSFESDVAPILAKSCAFSSCHGSRNVGNRGVFLGATTADNIAGVKSGLTAPSRALPTMPYVTPGDPEKSFLMHKLDGDLCVLEANCTHGSCGNPMPDGNPILPEDSRDAIRRWISQGAK